MANGNRRNLRAVSIALAVAAFTAIAAPAVFAAQGDFTLQAVYPPTHTLTFQGATGIAYVPNGGVATFEQTVFIADPVAKSVVGIKADGTLIGPWSGPIGGGEPFVEPTDVAADITGHLYVADKGRSYIYKLNATTGQLIERIGAGLVDAVGIDWTYEAASSSSDMIFVADANGRILRFADTSDTSGGFAYTAGGTLRTPADVDAKLTTGGMQLWVTDTARNKVVGINSGTSGVFASWGATGSAAGSITAPVGIAVRDSDTGHVVVTDESGRAQLFTQNGTYQSTLLASGQATGTLSEPRRISLDPANNFMWIAEKERAQLFNEPGAFNRAVGGGPGADLGKFNAPGAMAADGAGNLYVCDTGNNRIQKIDIYGTATAFGSVGTGDGQFMSPGGIAVDRDGYIYVSDTLNHRIQKFDSAGVHVATWGNLGPGPGQFDHPKGIGVDSEGNIYVADTWNSRIRKLAPNGDSVKDWTAYVYSDLAVGPDDRIFACGNADMYASSGSVLEFDSEGVFSTTRLPEEFYGNATGLDISRARTIYACDSAPGWPAHVVVQSWLPWLTGGYFSHAASGGGPGQFGVTGDVAIAQMGIVYVSDPALHRIQRFQIEDTTPPFINAYYFDDPGWQSYASAGVAIPRPTDALAGPLETRVSVDGGAPYVIWSASEEATANPWRSVSVTGEGTHTILFWAIDEFGNREDTHTTLAKIDNAFPEATVTITPSTWTTGNVEASVFATDSGAGISTLKYKLTRDQVLGPFDYETTVTVTDEGVTAFGVEIIDGAGKRLNRGGYAYIDRTAPTTTLWKQSIADTSSVLLWSIVDINSGGSEQTGGFSTYWRVGEQLPTVGANVTISTPGTYTVTYWSVDLAGNKESEETTQVVIADEPTGGGDPGGGGTPGEGFLIAAGAEWLNSSSLPIASNVSGAAQMRFKLTGDADWRDWVDYSAQVTVTADPGATDGDWNVEAQYRDSVDDPTPQDFSAVVGMDRVPPHTTSNASEPRTFSVSEPITLVSDDDRSTVAKMWYIVDGGPATEYSGSLYLGGGVHAFSWWSVDRAGNVEDAHAATVTINKTQPELSTTSGSATIAYGKTHYLTGRLTADGLGLPYKPVTLQLSAGEWQSTTVVVPTDANGYYRFALSPTSRTTYRAFYAGDATYLSCGGSPVVVTSLASVTNPVAPSTMYVGKAKTVYGFVKPYHTTYSYPVRIYKYRYVNRVWKSYGYVNAKAYNYSTYTKYVVNLKLPYKGSWRLRAFHPADADHAATWSPGYDFVTVK